jgi:DNA invertase Pin-like site-specific DNA recombinase
MRGRRHGTRGNRNRARHAPRSADRTAERCRADATIPQGELQAAAKRHGWQVVETFADGRISGAKLRDKRPGLDKLLEGAARKE